MEMQNENMKEDEYTTPHAPHLFIHCILKLSEYAAWQCLNTGTLSTNPLEWHSTFEKYLETFLFSKIFKK